MQDRQMTQTGGERARTTQTATEELLREAVRRIRSVGKPLRIVLFGSHATGSANEYSDFDFLIVESNGIDCRAQKFIYWDVLGEVFKDSAVDVLVESIDEVLRWRNVPGHVITGALRDGRVLYEESSKSQGYELPAECLADGTTMFVQEGIQPKRPSDLAREWFRRADADLNTGELIAEEGETFDMACFCAQQAIEKYFKGFLVLHGKTWPKTHSLDDLRHMCLQVRAVPGLTRDSLKFITEYACARYKPDFWPAREEAMLALSVAAEIREVILSAVPQAARAD